MADATKPFIGEPGLGSSVVLDPVTEARLTSMLDESPRDEPGLRLAKRLFFAQRISEGMSPEGALVAARRRFVTPGEAEARRRVVANRGRLVGAGVFGVGVVRGEWRVDKPDVYALTGLPLAEARTLVEDAVDAFLSFGTVAGPAPSLEWWYLDGGWRP